MGALPSPELIANLQEPGTPEEPEWMKEYFGGIPQKYHRWFSKLCQSIHAGDLYHGLDCPELPADKPTTDAVITEKGITNPLATS